MRIAALVNLALAACAQASNARRAPATAPDAKIAGAPRPGWPYLNHPLCTWDHWGIFGAYHTITVSGVDDIPKVCGDLWAAIDKFPVCRMLVKTSCGGTDGYLEWKFHAGFSCNFGLVASSWYSATKNKLGVLDCHGEQPRAQPNATVEVPPENEKPPRKAPRRRPRF
ncbi:hypothetical protein LY78DRAFT_439398 [Colletotrichum sublineola]|uniref:Uncharacterized protein n=1 Tax=Colletotrichum sublineola TaxID=1173701 RepID=A0A066XUH3_COLSU|nr:hypothetical protein LY78DRAFT_439398 [Colletotrichum sublineola]KDN71339.1 hypothetical protein CSUB01_11712 [Colletotrichum sublineola]